MEATMFKLVATEDRSRIFALGLWIQRNDGTEEAVTYRRDPHSGHTTFAVFGSPEAARTRLSTVVPVTLEWSTPDPPLPRVCTHPIQLRRR